MAKQGILKKTVPAVLFQHQFIIFSVRNFTEDNGILFFFFSFNRGDTIQYHGDLQSRELGQAPVLLVFLTPRQALSSHPCVFIMFLWESMNFHPD